MRWRQGARCPGDGGPRAQGPQAQGPGVGGQGVRDAGAGGPKAKVLGTRGQGAGDQRFQKSRSLRFCKLIAPSRVVNKASVTLPTSVVREREASLCTPADELIHYLL